MAAFLPLKSRRSSLQLNLPVGAIEVCESRLLLSNLLQSESSPAALSVSSAAWGELTESRNDFFRLRHGQTVASEFHVAAGQQITFDIDPKKENWQGRLELYDSNGTLLADNQGGVAPREEGRPEGFLEWTFENAGTFVLHVSSNTSGKFTLQTNPINRVLSESGNGGSLVTGLVTMPNRNQHLKSTPITLERIGPTLETAPLSIQENVITWIVIHGRTDSAASFRELAETLAQQTGDQVLVLDWSSAAADNHRKPGNLLDGAEWIPSVGKWLASYLQQKGITPEQTRLVGHSWGSYVAYEVARDRGGVQGIIALDPARSGYGYDFSTVDFGSMTHLSWAFYGTGLYGSEQLAATADESFTAQFSNATPDFSTRHAFVVEWFHQLIGELVPKSTNWNDLFSLTRFDTPSVSDDWTPNQYRDETANPPGSYSFEGIFEILATDVTHPKTWTISQLLYKDLTTGLAVELPA